MEILSLRYRSGFVDVEIKWNERVQTLELGPIGLAPAELKALQSNPSRELGFNFLQRAWVVSEIAERAHVPVEEVRQAATDYLDKLDY